MRKEKKIKKVMRHSCFLPEPTKYFLPKMGRKLKHRPPVYNSMTIVFLFLPLIFTFLLSFSYPSICSICLRNQIGGFFSFLKKKISNFLFVLFLIWSTWILFFFNQCWSFFFLIEQWLSHTHTHTHTHIYIMENNFFYYLIITKNYLLYYVIGA